ncbi:MAG: hypothetical protein ACKOGE_06920, partial [Actinomycetota bacterium]
MATRAEPAAEDRGLARVWGLVAAGAPPNAVEQAVIDEARALAGCEAAALVPGDAGGTDALLARAAITAGRPVEESDAGGVTAIAGEVGPAGAGGTALVVRAPEGGELDPAVAEPLARLALVAGMGIAGA